MNDNSSSRNIPQACLVRDTVLRYVHIHLMPMATLRSSLFNRETEAQIKKAGK